MAEKEDRVELAPLPMPAEIREATALLKSLTETDVPRIPEELFRTRILPIMADTSGNVDVSIWLDIAGSVHRPIDVEDPLGNLLFRVPAMMSPLPTYTNARAQDSMGEVVALAKLKKEQHPRLGEVALEMGLNRRVPKPRLDIDKARQWNAILVRYGYPPMPLAGHAPLEESTATVADAGKPRFSDLDDEL